LDGGTGFLRIQDANGDALLQFTARQAELVVGGGGHPGHVVLRNALGTVTTIHLDAEQSMISLRSPGVAFVPAGIEMIRFEAGSEAFQQQSSIRLNGLTDDNTPVETIHLDGMTGDIILHNADCAEEFDVASLDGIEPGTVMVIGDEGALQPSTEEYDKRVVGV